MLTTFSGQTVTLDPAQIAGTNAPCKGTPNTPAPMESAPQQEPISYIDDASHLATELPLPRTEADETSAPAEAPLSLVSQPGANLAAIADPVADLTKASPPAAPAVDKAPAVADHRCAQAASGTGAARPDLAPCDQDLCTCDRELLSRAAAISNLEKRAFLLFRHNVRPRCRVGIELIQSCAGSGNNGAMVQDQLLMPEPVPAKRKKAAERRQKEAAELGLFDVLLELMPDEEPPASGSAATPAPGTGPAV